MKFTLKALVILLVVSLTSCGGSTDPTKEMIKSFLAETEGVNASAIKITEVSDPIAWTVADSMDILLKEFNAMKEEKIGHIEQAIASAKLAIEQAEEAKKGGFRALNDIADETIAQSRSTIEQANLLLEKLNGNCEGTDLEGLFNKIMDYTPKKEEVLFQRIYGKWSREGESSGFDLRVSNDMSTILGSFN